MCSLMEKDALIEKVAETMALISKHKKVLENSEEDSIAMGKLSAKIYISNPYELDFFKIVELCDEIQNKYAMNSSYEIQFQEIWNDILKKCPYAISSLNPIGFVLGGQSGAGKSQRFRDIIKSLEENVIIINADEIRRYHPNFFEIQAQYGDDAPKYTAQFAGEMTEKLLNKAVSEKYNIAIEGTFRTAETPIKTLDLMKSQGYKTVVHIQTCPKKVSWNNTIDRYHAMKKAGLSPRAVDENHHNLICDKLGENADKVLFSGKVDELLVFSRSTIIFNSNLDKDKLPSIEIEKELNDKEFEDEELIKILS